MEGLANMTAIIRPLAIHGAIDPVIAENPRKQVGVREIGDVLRRRHLGSEEACDHQRQRRVFCPADRNDAVERMAALDADLVH